MIDGRLAQIPGVKPVKKVRPDGRVDILFYHRATGFRLPDDPTSAEFKLALAKASEPILRKPVETFRSLILKYKASPDWVRLRPSTREIEQFNVNAIEAEFGDLPLAVVEERGARAMFLEWRDEVAEKHPRAADAKLTRLACILKFALDREIIARHPLLMWKRLHKVDRSEVVWLPEHFRLLGNVASPEVQLAAFIALHTGQRRGDLLAFRWRQFDGERIKFMQQKAGARVDIPCTQALRAALLKLRASRQPEETDHILLGPDGRPWALEAWRSAWRRTMAAAAIPPIIIEQDNGRKEYFNLHFHDIRGTAVTMLADAGCTVPEICSITGHTLTHASRVLARYLGSTRIMADAAIAKFETRLNG